MTKFTFRNSALYARIAAVVDETVLSVIDKNAAFNGGDLIAALDQYERKLEALIAQYEGYTGPAAARHAADFRAKLVTVRLVEREEPVEPCAVPFRAAYFVSADGQSDVLLTDDTMADMPEAELLAEARELAAQVGLDLEAGRLVVGSYTR